ncbi:hypothetical protein [Leptospira noguchii]|nr:hypothetical protein [Leptospira noguchii]
MQRFLKLSVSLLLALGKLKRLTLPWIVRRNSASDSPMDRST